MKENEIFVPKPQPSRATTRNCVRLSSPFRAPLNYSLLFYIRTPKPNRHAVIVFVFYQSLRASEHRNRHLVVNARYNNITEIKRYTASLSFRCGPIKCERNINLLWALMSGEMRRVTVMSRRAAASREPATQLTKVVNLFLSLSSLKKGTM